MRRALLILTGILMLALVACGGGQQTQPTTDSEQPLEKEVITEGSGEEMMESDDAVAPPPNTLAATAPAAQVEAQSVVSAPLPVGTANSGVTQPTPDAMTFDNPGTNPFLDTEDDNLSTFAMDVDTGSYTIARSYLVGSGQLPPDDAIRPEEFINYFDAGYDSPGGSDAFAIYMDIAPAPFGYEGHYLMRVGIQGKYIAPEDRQPALLIFVIDVSGSMSREDRLELVKEALAILVDELREDDRVGIVVYSDNSRAVLNPTSASDKQTIMAAINALQPEGSTNVEDGLRLGYQLAEQHMREGEITRVITLSDGVANVGSTGPDAILKTIRDGVEKGITLSTIGFGMGNYNDTLMEQLANDGNGNYYYVDNLREARRVFVHNLTGTLQVIGFDAKVQVEFNPEVADRYRLIGYENRAIADEDFRDDTVDAGEVGAGHSITALYEVALEKDGDFSADSVIATAFIRYQDAETREVVEQQQSLTVGSMMSSLDDAPPSFRLQAGVAEFSELLRGSFWAEGGSYGAVLALVEPLKDEMPNDEQLDELIELMRLAVRYGDA